jgi:hypothetical protein
MRDRIEINGLTFYLEVDGFRGSAGDWDEIVDAVRHTLERLPAAKLFNLHSGSLTPPSEADGPFINEVAYDKLHSIVYRAARPVLKRVFTTDEVGILVHGV